MTLDSALLLGLASFGAGLVNAIAGGGTMLTFPALLGAGLAERVANATSTVGLTPAAVSGSWAFRRDVARGRRWLWVLLPASLCGGGVGAWLLLVTPDSSFRRLVPWLVLGATLLFAFGRRIAVFLGRSDEHRLHLHGLKVYAAVAPLQFAIAVYGGYFGAGIGIMMLAAHTLIGLGDLPTVNGLKNLCVAATNGTAAVVLIARRGVDLPAAAVVIAGAVLGSLVAPRVASTLRPERLRWVVIATGIIATVVLFSR